MGITAKELAHRLGLSEAAVSLALNNRSGVSTETKRRVLQAAEEWGYDFTRVTVRRRRNGIVYFIYYRKHGAIVNDNPFFAELTEGVERTCKQRDMRLNVRYLYEEDDLERQLGDIVSADCAGILLLATEMRLQDFAPFEELNVPLVVLDTWLESARRDCVLIDNNQGAFLATDHLIRKIKQQPGYLRSAYEIHNFEQRADGFYRAVRRHGYSSSKCPVHRLTPTIDGAYADMTELLRAGEIPARGYFADNDSIAIGAMKAFRAQGFSVPGDVAVIGFDNVDLCNYCDPALTTVNVPKAYMGAMAVERLLQLMESDHFVPVKLEIQTNLVLRRSV